jgi:hypothetical protein
MRSQVHSGRLHKRNKRTIQSIYHNYYQSSLGLRFGSPIMHRGLQIHTVLYINAKGLYAHNTANNTDILAINTNTSRNMLIITIPLPGCLRPR